MNALDKVRLGTLLREYIRLHDREWDALDLGEVPRSDLIGALAKRLSQLKSINGWDSNEDIGEADRPTDLSWIRDHLLNSDLSQAAVGEYKAKLLAAKRCVGIAFWVDSDPPTDNSDFLFETYPPVVPRPRLAPTYFSKQRSIPGAFSGFVASPTRFVTTSHTVPEGRDVSELCIVFDFVAEQALASPLRVPPERLRRPVREVYRGKGDQDFVILEIPPVEGRTPAIRQDGKIGDGDRIHIIGHPYGFPMKIAGHENVGENSHDTFFENNLDVLGGHSGAPVFNASTHVIEGILRSAGKDVLDLGIPGDFDEYMIRCALGGCVPAVCVRSTSFTPHL